jgi:hypothetical protein
MRHPAKQARVPHRKPARRISEADIAHRDAIKRMSWNNGMTSPWAS